MKNKIKGRVTELKGKAKLPAPRSGAEASARPQMVAPVSNAQPAPADVKGCPGEVT